MGTRSRLVGVVAGLGLLSGLVTSSLASPSGVAASGRGVGPAVTPSVVTTAAVSPSAAIAISAGGDHTCALLSSGTAKCWGRNNWGQLGNGSTELFSAPLSVSGISTATAISAGSDVTCALLSDGTVKCWGDNESGQLGDGSTTHSSTPVAVSGISTATAISAGGYHTCALLSGGTVECWGYNYYYGQLGNGSTDWSSTTPVAVSGISTATAISAGYQHTCAILSGGTVKCWGANGAGQLGNGTTTNSSTPVTVSGITTAIAISAGEIHTCALLSSGTVKCWGANGAGQLGNDGSPWDSNTPVTVSGIFTAIAVSAGDAHTCALLSGGTVKCWGWNYYGQLGDGSTTQRDSPVAVSGLTGATAITAGELHTCAVLSGGTAKCWGYGLDGELGNGSTDDSGTPVPVSGISTATAISAGSEDTCALLSGGAAKCWGDNEAGQLGNGSTTSSNTPVAVSGISTATAISAGGGHTCAVLSGGTAKCWGYKGYGQLGNGTAVYSSVPVAVAGFTASLVVSGFPSPDVAGVAHGFSVKAVDAYGKTAAGYLGTVHFTSSDPLAKLPANYTFTATDAGTHVFTVTLETAGSQSVTATDTVTASIKGIQSGIVVNPAAATHLSVSTVNPYVAGVAHSVTVTAKDVYGNTATGYLGTVTFTSTDAKALLPANYTFTAADNGVHTFSVTLKTAGTQAVRARDTVTSTITGAQYGIVVTPAAAKTLVVSGLASPRTAGVAGIVTVTARDAFGNSATGYLGTIKFTSTDSKALLPADYKFTAANAGTHTFSVTLKTAGTQAVRARDTVTATLTGAQMGIVVT